MGKKNKKKNFVQPIVEQQPLDENQEYQNPDEIVENTNQHVEMFGTVLEVVRGTIKIEVESGQVILAHLSGKMKMNKIHILPEDKVKVKLSPYDLNRGIVVRRIKQ